MLYEHILKVSEVEDEEDITLLMNPKCRLPPVGTKLVILITNGDDIYLVEAIRTSYASSYTSLDIGYELRTEDPVLDFLKHEVTGEYVLKKYPWIYSGSLDKEKYRQWHVH